MNLVDWYKYVIDYFKRKGVEVFIHGSTLLGAVRNQKLLERITLDKEINLGIRAEDLNIQLMWDMKNYFPYFFPTGERLENSLIYFGPEPIIKYHSCNKSHWDMEPGIGLLAVFWKGKTKRFEYMGGDLCLTWPMEYLDRFSNITLEQRVVNTPLDYHRWLSHYYGDDYEIEKLNWHWSSDSKNLELFKSLKEQGEIC